MLRGPRTIIPLLLLVLVETGRCFMLPLRRAIGTGIMRGTRAAAGGAACMSSDEKEPMRVGVVGAGVAGCALAKKLTEAGAHVTVFEMGRGAGGRMATRKTRDCPGLAINHGAPLFVATQDAFREMLAPLLATGAVTKWQGRVVDIDDGDFRPKARALEGEGYVSSPDMNSMCEALVDGLDKRFGTQVAAIERADREWVLFGKDHNELGRFDWCVFTSHTCGHTRWQQVFGFAPPLCTLADKEPALKQIVEPLQSVESQAVMVAMVAFKREDANAILSLEFDVAHVTNHPTLSRVVRHESGEGGHESFVSLCFHSTPEFAKKYEFVYGSTSAAAKLSADKWKSEENRIKEQEVLAELMAAGKEVLLKLAVEAPTPVFGPVLHRWGSAFTYSGDSPRVDERLGLAVCGDFAGQESMDIYRGVESAALSGLHVAQTILSSTRARL